MDTQHTIDIEGMAVTVIKKDIKNMYLRISKDGVLSITAPRSQSRKDIRRFVLSKQEWIQKGLKKVANRPVIVEPQFI